MKNWNFVLMFKLTFLVLGGFIAYNVFLYQLGIVPLGGKKAPSFVILLIAQWYLVYHRQQKSQDKSIHFLNLFALQYVFVSDDDLHQINLEFLNHDTLTDIITFDLGTTSTEVDGEIYISLDRVKENSITLNTPYCEELIRVVSHGLLHLIGFKDKTSKDAAIMRSKEEECLSLWRSIQ